VGSVIAGKPDSTSGQGRVSYPPGEELSVYVSDHRITDAMRPDRDWAWPPTTVHVLWAKPARRLPELSAFAEWLAACVVGAACPVSLHLAYATSDNARYIATQNFTGVSELLAASYCAVELSG
jgi:hypothetical protein